MTDIMFPIQISLEVGNLLNTRLAPLPYRLWLHELTPRLGDHEPKTPNAIDDGQSICPAHKIVRLAIGFRIGMACLQGQTTDQSERDPTHCLLLDLDFGRGAEATFEIDREEGEVMVRVDDCGRGHGGEEADRGEMTWSGREVYPGRWDLTRG